MFEHLSDKELYKIYNEIKKEEQNRLSINREYIKKYRKENKEKLTEYFSKNRDRIKENSKLYLKKNKEKWNEYHRLYYKKNRIKLNLRQRYLQKLKIINEKNKKWINNISPYIYERNFYTATPEDLCNYSYLKIHPKKKAGEKFSS